MTTSSTLLLPPSVAAPFLPTLACPLLDGPNLECPDGQYAARPDLVGFPAAAVLNRWCAATCVGGNHFCPSSLCHCPSAQDPVLWSLLPPPVLQTTLPTVNRALATLSVLNRVSGVDGVPIECAGNVYVSKIGSPAVDAFCQHSCAPATDSTTPTNPSSRFCPSNVCTCGNPCPKPHQTPTTLTFTALSPGTHPSFTLRGVHFSSSSGIPWEIMPHPFTADRQIARLVGIADIYGSTPILSLRTILLPSSDPNDQKSKYNVPDILSVITQHSYTGERTKRQLLLPSASTHSFNLPFLHTTSGVPAGVLHTKITPEQKGSSKPGSNLLEWALEELVVCL